MSDAVSNRYLNAMSARLERRFRAQQQDELFRRLEYFSRNGDRKSEGHTLGAIGSTFHGIGRTEVALVYYMGALAAFREVGDHGCEGITFSNAGSALQSLGRLHEALDSFREGQKVARERGDFHGEAADTDKIANVLTELGLTDEALKEHRHARELARADNDPKLILLTMMNEAASLHRLRRDDEALSRYSEGSLLAQELKEPQAIASCESNLGNILDSRGDHAQALEHYEFGIAIYRELGDRESHAVGLVNLAGTLRSLGRNEEALGRYEESLALFSAIGRADGQATCMRGIAEFRHSEGRRDEAFALHLRALELSRISGDAWSQMRSLAEIAPILHRQGKPQEALECHRQALRAARILGDEQAIAEELLGMSAIRTELQEYDQAVEDLETALATTRGTGILEAEVALLSRLAWALLARGELETSAELLSEARSLATKAKDPAVEAGALAGLGEVALRLGKPKEAIGHFERARSIYREENRLEREAWCLQALGRGHQASGDTDTALQLQRQALVLVESIGDKPGTQNVLANLGILCAERKELRQSNTYLEAAAELVEAFRSKYTDERDRIAFFSGWVDVYAVQLETLYLLTDEEPDDQPEGLIDALFLCAERFKARTFVETQERLRIGGSGPEGDQYRRLNAERQAAANRVSELSAQHATAVTEADLGKSPRDIASRLEAEIEAAQEEARASLSAAAELETRIRDKDSRLVAFAETGRAIGLDTVDRELLDDDTVVLHFTFVADRCLTFRLTKETTEISSISPRGVIEQQVRELRLAVTRGYRKGLRSYPHGHALYQSLIGSMAERLWGKTKLLIIPDGILGYLPFSLLLERPPDGRDEDDGISLDPPGEAGDEAIVNRLLSEESEPFDWETLQYLGRRFSIRYLPSATAGVLGARGATLDDAGRPPLCACAAPLARSSTQSASFRELRWAAAEVEAVRDLFRRCRLESDLEPAADRNVVIARAAEGPRPIWHLSCHCLVDDRDADASRLVLEPLPGEIEPSTLSLTEILNISMPCELVTLSACDTGHGRFVRGEGMLAFSRAFMAAGARSVCASFWPVNDRSAPVLMDAFYRRLLTPGCSREEALARAQAEMLKSPFSHPYHWASFGIWGDGGVINPDP